MCTVRSWNTQQISFSVSESAPFNKKLAVNEITYKLDYTYSHPHRDMEDH